MKIMHSVAMFLPRLRSLEIFLREDGGHVESLAALEVQPRHSDHSLLEMKQFLKEFRTMAQLQVRSVGAGC